MPSVTAFAFLLAVAPAAPSTPPEGAKNERRDPFLAVALVDPAPSWCDVGPLACANLDELKLSAVVVDTASPRAMFEDAEGRGTIVRIGDTVGAGRVRSVRRDGVVIERRYRNGMDGVVQELAKVELAWRR
jgi:Tfp pilus assembly protein PilP